MLKEKCEMFFKLLFSEEKNRMNPSRFEKAISIVSCGYSFVVCWFIFPTSVDTVQ